jgi:hypothetical protein
VKPSITATLTVEVCGGHLSLVVALPGIDGAWLTIPLDESPAAVRKLLRDLAGRILAQAHR